MQASQLLGPITDQLTMEQAQILMCDAKEVRKACIRAGHIMPPAADKINNNTFCRGVQ